MKIDRTRKQIYAQTEILNNKFYSRRKLMNNCRILVWVLVLFERILWWWCRTNPKGTSIGTSPVILHFESIALLCASFSSVDRFVHTKTSKTPMCAVQLYSKWFNVRNANVGVFRSLHAFHYSLKLKWFGLIWFRLCCHRLHLVFIDLVWVGFSVFFYLLYFFLCNI